MSGNDDRRWTSVDELLFQGARIPALAAAREQFAWSLAEATERVPRRWQYLVDKNPEAFTVPIEGYWNGVYT